MLKQLMLSKRADKTKESLEELRAKEIELDKRASDLAVAIEEAETVEELNTVEEEAEKIQTEKESLETEKESLETTLKSIESELTELESQDPQPEEDEKEPKERSQFLGGQRMKVNKFETRSEMLERLAIPEVRSFYEDLTVAIKEKRALEGGTKSIPTQVVDMVLRRVSDISVLYNEVQVEKLTGNARVIVDGNIPEGIWVECCESLQELTYTMNPIELDCFKVGGYTSVCNAIIDDSSINIANYIEERLAISIAKALDKAILNGTGTKQPQGIITLSGITKVETDGKLANILKEFGSIGSMDTISGPMIAVMSRETYYTYIASQLMRVSEDGRLITMPFENAVLPDGTRILVSDYTPKNTIVVGDFKRYILGERKSITIEESKHAQFIQDNTVFKGLGRFDGKPVEKESFKVITVKVGE